MTSIPQRTAAQNAVGSINGQLTVSEMGAAVYSVTFDVPNGGRMAPQVGLAYNSQSAGYGLAGYGIDITGLSVITSGGRDMFHNGRVKGANYDGDGNLYLDGKRLVLQSGDDGMDGAVYAPEGDPHTKVTQHGGYGANSVPTFEVSTKDGGRIVYGGDAGSRFEFSKNGTLRCAAWYVSHAENKYGEGMAYAYTKDNLCIRPQSITYGREGASCSVEFAYRQMRLGNERHFRIAGQQGVNDKVLDYVTTKMSGSVYRRYDFQYDETASDHFSRLTTIIESNGAGESLNPTELTWNMPVVNMEINHTDNTDVPQKLSDWRGYDNDRNAGYMAVDLNGDGISDIVRLCSGKRGIEGINDWYYYMAAYVHTGYIDTEGHVRYKEPLMYWFPAQTTNWPNEEDPIIKNSLGSTAVMDFDGDGLNDLIFPYYTDYGGVKFEDLYILYGKDVKDRVAYSRLQQTTLTLQRTDDSPLHATMDLNGDGRDDIIALETAGDEGNYMIKILACNGRDADGNLTLDTSTKDITLPSVPKHLFTGDYDGDGLADLFVACEDGYAIYHNQGCAKGQKPTAAFSGDRNTVGTSVKGYWRMSQGDFDGDGQMDFLYFDNDSSMFGIAWHNGDGTFRNQTLPDNWGVYDHKDTYRDDSKFTMTVTDVDGDGKSDVLLSKGMFDYHSGGLLGDSYYRYGKTLVRWLHSTGSDFELTEAYEFNGDDESNEGMFMAGDFDGDGKIETANYGARLDADYSMDASDVLHIYRTGNYGASAGRLASVTDGFGNTATLDYAYATDKAVYEQTEQPKPNTYWEWDEQGKRVRITEPSINMYPVNRYTLPTVLVSAMRTQDADIRYTYKDLRLHIAGCGMLGFGTVEKKNNTLGVTETMEVSKWNLQLYQPQETLTTTTVHATGETATTRMEYAMANHGVWYCKRKNQTDYDGNKTYMVTGLDDETGLSTGTSEGDGDSWNDATVFREDNIYDFTFAGGSWHPVERYMVTHHEDDVNDAMSYESYAYDDKGNLSSVTVTGMVFNEDESLYADGESIKTDYTYDRWGNVLSETFRGNDATTGRRYYKYDSTGRFLIREYTSPASYIKTYTYDQWGHLLTETDATNASHPLTTTHQYDAWGRRTHTTYPDGTESTYETNWTGNNGGWYTMESHTAAPWKKTTYDRQGREVKVETVGAKDISISKTTEYNDKGQVSKVTDTYGSRTTTETYAYDARGRVISDQHSSGAGVTYEYGRNTVTTTDAAGRSVTKTYDAWGSVKRVKDPAQTTVEYTYCSNGKPSSITAGDATVTMEYDEFGRRTRLVDPDAGETVTTYDKAGHVLTETDGRGVKTTNTYDALGRLTLSRREGTAEQLGETDARGIVYGTSGSSKGRIVKKVGDCGTITYEYDDLGRVVSESRGEIRNHDNTADQLRKTYTYDSKGQLASVTYPASHSAEGLTVYYEYDSHGFWTKTMYQNRRLSWLKTLSEDKEMIQSSFVGSRETSYDAYGNVSARCYRNMRHNIRGSLSYAWDYPTGNMTERTVNGRTERYAYDELDRLVSADGSQSMNIVYADNGNIIDKTGIGAYSYDAADKPHAVRSVENTVGLIDTREIHTSYALNGKVCDVWESGMGAYSHYDYGPDDEKWSSWGWTKEDSTLEYDVEREYWGEYERLTEDNHIREYYFLDNDVLIIRENPYEDDFFTEKVYQVVRDNLGSIIAVVNAAGGKVFEAEYDAWGRQTVTRNDIRLSRGYTGHEMLSTFGLIHMDGRVYDPVIGRFLSPDNYVQLPENSQSFNRYSYCINNPLKYTDPTGQLFGIDDAVIAFAVFNMASSMAMAAWNGESVWKAAGISILSSAASYGIGGLFSGPLQGISGTFGGELLRAGAHGLASGITSALSGENFGRGFASGFASSAMGSFGSYVDMNDGLMLASGAAMGGLTEWALGGDFLSGALNGMIVVGMNHMQHIDDKKLRRIYKAYLRENYYSDGKKIPAATLCRTIGGELTEVAEGIKNSCALRLSIALNNSGYDIPSTAVGAKLGGDGKYYIISAKAMQKHLSGQFSKVCTVTNAERVKNAIIYQYPDGMWAGQNITGHVDVVYRRQWASHYMYIDPWTNAAYSSGAPSSSYMYHRTELFH